MWWHTRRNQIRSSSETDESIYIGGGVSSVEYWLSSSAGRGRTIVVTLDGLFRVRLKTAGYPLHSPLSPSLLLPCVTVCHQFPFPLYPCPLNTLLYRIYTYKRGNPARKSRWKKLSSSEQVIMQNTGRCKMHEHFVYSGVLKIHHFYHHAYRGKYKWNRNQKKK